MKTSRLQLESLVKDMRTETTVLSCALNDILNGDVKWFSHSHTFSIGVTRPTSACGGIAVVRQTGTSGAYYFEEYARRELEHIAACITGENTEHNRELAQRRSAIESAKAYVADQLRTNA